MIWSKQIANLSMQGSCVCDCDCSLRSRGPPPGVLHESSYSCWLECSWQCNWLGLTPGEFGLFASGLWFIVTLSVESSGCDGLRNWSVRQLYIISFALITTIYIFAFIFILYFWKKTFFLHPFTTKRDEWNSYVYLPTCVFGHYVQSATVSITELHNFHNYMNARCEYIYGHLLKWVHIVIVFCIH